MKTKKSPTIQAFGGNVKVSIKIESGLFKNNPVLSEALKLSPIYVYDADNSCLTFSKLQNALEYALERHSIFGITDCVALVNNGAYTNLLSDQAALRMYDSSYVGKLSDDSPFCMNIGSGKMFIVQHDEVPPNSASIITVDSKALSDSHITIQDVNIEVFCNKDYSTVKFEPKSLIKINHIVNS